MNIYIYDNFLTKNKYKRTLNRVEIRLTDLGLNGKIIRLGLIKNVKEFIQSEIKNGARNITAVGNNLTVNKIINAILTDNAYDFFKKDLLFSIIPIGDNNSIANSFGISKAEEACDIILARRKKEIDVGIAKESLFLNKLDLNSVNLEIDINNEFKLKALKQVKLSILNINSNKKFPYSEKISPCDRRLDLLIEGKKNDLSFISSSIFNISGEGEAILDDSLKIKAPFKVGLFEKKLNIIVGKNRSFL